MTQRITDETIARLIRRAIQRESKDSIFDLLVKEILDWTDEPVHNLADLRFKKSKKSTGDLFERFVKLYLISTGRFSHVWLLNEIPETVLVQLKLKRQDLGIDLVAKVDEEYVAIQVKFRNPLKSRIDWKSLSTFYALCARTGPWKRHIVATNLSSIRRVGEKSYKDESICLGTFRKLNSIDFCQMLAVPSDKIIEQVPDVDRLRALRLVHFCQ